MYKTNMSLLDRASLKSTIRFIETLLASPDSMSPPMRKRAITVLKTYQNALELTEKYLIKTGGHFSITNKDEVSHEKLVKDSIE